MDASPFLPLLKSATLRIEVCERGNKSDLNKKALLYLRDMRYLVLGDYDYSSQADESKTTFIDGRHQGRVMSSMPPLVLSQPRIDRSSHGVSSRIPCSSVAEFENWLLNRKYGKW